ncbi:MAG: hypothetical protein V3U84_08350 [Thiotrichaceae bacterium]
MFKSFFSKVIVITLLSFTVNTASAEAGLDSRIIKSIITYSSGVLLEFTVSVANAENCDGNLAENYVFLLTDTSGGKQMLATVLAARVSDKPVALGINGCLNWSPGFQVPLVYKVIF